MPPCARARASTGRTSSRPSPKPRAVFPTAIIDGEVVALDHNGAPDFAALQAALSEGRSQDLVFFVFDLLFEGGEDLRALAAHRAQGAAQERCSATRARMLGTSSMSSILSEPGDAVLQSACRMHLEGIISKRLSAPYQSGRTESWHQVQMPWRP